MFQEWPKGQPDSGKKKKKEKKKKGTPETAEEEQKKKQEKPHEEAVTLREDVMNHPVLEEGPPKGQ